MLEYALTLSPPVDAEAGESVLAAAVSDDGQYAAVTTVDGAVSVWNVGRREEIQSWPSAEFGGGARFLHFTAGGALLLLAGIDYSVERPADAEGDLNYFMLRNTDDGEIVRIWALEGARLTAISAAADGSKILAGFSNGLITLFNVDASTREDFSLHTGKITDIELSPDGRFAISSAVDATALYWNVDDGEVLQRFSHRNRATVVAADNSFSTGFSSDALDNQRLWDLTSGKQIAALGHQQRWMYISNARFSSTGKRLLIASPSKAVSVWNAINGDRIASWHIDHPVVDVAETSLGDIVSIGSTGVVELWRREW
ncbi:MAG: PQQ-binding-like beta-propeller repeat protein [Halioglobus sp.]